MQRLKHLIVSFRYLVNSFLMKTYLFVTITLVTVNCCKREVNSLLKEQLIKLRKENNKTQEDIAKLLGITRPAYTAYEAGNRKPDYDSLIKLSEYYGVSLDFLLKGKDNKKDNKGNLFFFDMKGLDDEELEDIKRYIEYVKWKSEQEGKK
jgi:transcriptional regulator with XRE-family HTH domain